jgi:hypothetical protein
VLGRVAERVERLRFTPSIRAEEVELL